MENTTTTDANIKVKTAKYIATTIICSVIFGGIGGIVAGSLIFPWMGKTFPVLQRFQVFQGGAEVQMIEKTQKQVLKESDAVIESVKSVQPSVVSIMKTKDVTDFFGRTYESTSGGTGFIVTSDGLIITNSHVVAENDAEYTVITDSGDNYKAQIKAIDSTNDLAIIKIEADNLPVASLGYSDTVDVGQQVIAIGNALGEYSNTVTSGIISGINRTITAGTYGSLNYETLEGVIQTDAAINYGNSGGPLVDLAGNVIGVNTAIDSNGALIAFAIPVGKVRIALESYVDSGQIVKPMIGVRYINITPDFAKFNNLPVEYGALVYSADSATLLPVVPGGPADKAGIKTGDIITKINGDAVAKGKSLASMIDKFKPGDKIEVTFLRDKSEATVTVTLDTLKQ